MARRAYWQKLGQPCRMFVQRLARQTCQQYSNRAAKMVIVFSSAQLPVQWMPQSHANCASRFEPPSLIATRCLQRLHFLVGKYKTIHPECGSLNLKASRTQKEEVRQQSTHVANSWRSTRKLLNFGPATTTFTAPKSCATAFKTGIAASSEPSAIRWDAQCTWTPPADCNPVGTRVQSLIASAGGPDIKIVDQFFIVYQSPGIICPSGQLTVGAAEKVNPTSTSVSGAFNVSDAVPTDDANPWLPGQLQVVLGALDAGETAILCCPRFVLCSIKVHGSF